LSIEADSYPSAALSPDGGSLFAVSAKTRRRPLEHRLPGLDAARLPRRGTRAHGPRVGRRAARQAVPLDLPPGVTKRIPAGSKFSPAGLRSHPWLPWRTRPYPRPASSAKAAFPQSRHNGSPRG
jgi:hypothetical protein